MTVAKSFNLEDRVIISEPTCRDYGMRGMVTGTSVFDDVLVEYDTDGSTHKFPAAWLASEGNVRKAAQDEYRRQCAMAMWIGSVPEWPAFYDAYIHGQI